MPDAERQLLNLLSEVRFEIIWLVVCSLGIYYGVEWIKGWIMDKLEQRRFLGNRYVSIGALVMVDDFSGRIKDISKDEILVEGEKGFLVIPTQRWRYYRWVFVRTKAENGGG